MIKYILTGLLLTGLYCESFCQNKEPLVIYYNAQMATPVLNSEGKELFRLSQGHVPITNHKNCDKHSTSVLSSSKTYPFDNGLMVVQRSDKSYYWLNEQGHMITDFGHTYSKMYRPVEGYVLADVPHARLNENWLVFLDSSGKNAFGDKQFRRAGEFSEGLAAVQLDQNVNSWCYIDKKGNVVFKLELSNIIALHPFKNGRAKVTTLDPTYKNQYHFIDINGKPVIDLQEIVKNREIHLISDFSEGLVSVLLVAGNFQKNDLLILNDRGDVIHRQSKVHVVGDYLKGVATISAWTDTGKSEKYESYLLNRKGQRVDIKAAETVKNINLEHVYGLSSVAAKNHTGITGYFTTVKDNYLRYFLADSTGKVEYIAPNPIFTSGESFVVERINSEYFKMIDLKGALLWQTHLKERLFTDLEEALNNREGALRYSYQYDSVIDSRLFQLKSLKGLEINYNSVEALPAAIGQLKELKTLKLITVHKIKALPKEMVQLKKLHTLVIHQCLSLKYIESVVTKLPSLRLLVVDDNVLSKASLEKIKATNPLLKIVSNQNVAYPEIPLPVE